MVHDGNIFELVHAQGGRTAWAGDRPGLVDLYRGPSGLGLDEAISISPGGESIAAASAADDRRVALMLHWIKGEDSTAHDRPGVPELFGMNFTAFAAAQRAPNAGYADMLGDPSEALTAQLRYIDTSVGRIVEDLRAEHLFDSTWIIVTATYTQSPGATRAPRSIPVERLRSILGKTPSSGAAYVSSEGAVTIWLQHPEMAGRVAQAYAAKSATLGIGEIYTPERLKLSLEPERSTSRSPDLVLFPAPGILWKSSARNGTTAQAGFRDEDKHVALLVSGAQLTGRTDPTSVPTSQTAAMLLRALGMEKLDLPALHREHSPALPGIF